MDTLFYITLYEGYNYLSMPGLKLNTYSKRDPRCYSFQASGLQIPYTTDPTFSRWHCLPTYLKKKRHSYNRVIMQVIFSTASLEYHHLGKYTLLNLLNEFHLPNPPEPLSSWPRMKPRVINRYNYVDFDFVIKIVPVAGGVAWCLNLIKGRHSIIHSLPYLIPCIYTETLFVK